MFKPLFCVFSPALWVLLPGLLFRSPAFAQEEYRILWVDAFGSGFKNASQVTQLIADTRAGNFNALAVEVRKRGDAYYNGSIYEPKATDVSPASFDPLQDMITKAHDTSGGQRRIEVHAWIVTYPISQTSSPGASHPMVLHPDWLTLDNTGANYDGNNYVFDPGHPGVQQHTFNVAMDIISRYDIDGLNLDYIRYTGKAWGYNPTTIQRFNRINNRTGQPSTTDAAWLQFRRDQVTALVRKLYLSAYALKPAVKVSADTICFAPGVTTDSAWLSSAAAYTDKLQDWRGWMQEGILDLNIPMMYFDEDSWASAWDNWSIFAKNHRYNRHVALGAAFYLNDIADSIVQLRSARDATSLGYRADGISGYVYKLTNDEGLSRATFLNALTQPSAYDPNNPPVFASPVATPSMTWKTSPTRGHLCGFVYDAGTGAALDYASVTLSSPASKVLRTDATGFFGAVDLVPGNYNMIVSFAGYQMMVTNVAIATGAVATMDLRLQQSVTPVIVSQPLSQTVVVGADATFTVSATGTPAPGYQWRFNGTDIPGATGTSYTRTNVAYTNAGGYTVYVFNSQGNTLSSNAVLTVASFDSPPLITRYPQNHTVIAGSNVTFSADVQGTGPFNYQWKLNGSPLPNRTNATLLLTNVSPANAGSYELVVANRAGSDTTLPFTLNVHYALNLSVSGNGVISKTPDLSSYPPNTTVTLVPSGQVFSGWSGSASGTVNPLVLTMSTNRTLTAAFTNEIVIDNTAATIVGSWATGTSAGYYGSGYHYKSSATGSAYLQFTPNLPAAGNYEVYTWHVAGGNRTTNAPHIISYNGGSQTIYVNQEINGARWVLLGTFSFAAGTGGYVRISDAANDPGGQVMADAIRFVATSAPAVAPAILSQPAGLSVIAGQSAAFHVTAIGPGTLNYQWRQDGTNIPGATTSLYNRSGLLPLHAGQYSVRVANGNGAVISSNATLNVTGPPSVSVQPLSATNNQGTPASFAVSASGSPPLFYRWRMNGLGLPGADAATYSITEAEPIHEGTYSAMVFNAAGATLSSNATLSVRLPPAILQQPTDLSANPGSNAAFTVTANGTPPLFYMWQKNGTNLPGETSTVLILSAVQNFDAGVYSVTVSNAAGYEVSDPAVLTINAAPFITVQPQSLEVAPGSNALFSVSATGTQPISYQWKFQGQEIPGATDPTLEIPDVQSTNVGYYSVVLLNMVSSVSSSNAWLTLATQNPPRIEAITLPGHQQVQLTISSGAGDFAIDVSPALVNWTNLATINATGTLWQFTDPQPLEEKRFYRIRKLPAQ